MEEQTNISGYWAALFVHFPSFEYLSMNLQDQNGTITGTYLLPEARDDPQPAGQLTGSVSGQTVVLSLPPENAHGPLLFQGTLYQQGEQLMIAGVVPLSGATVPFATLTAFRGAEGDRLNLMSAWSALEFGA